MRRAAELALLALGNLRRTPLRVCLTAFGIAIATGALVSMVGFALGLQAKVEEPFQKFELLNRIDVSPERPTPSTDKKNGGETGMTTASRASPPLLDDAALARIASLPAAALVYPDFRLERVEVRYTAAVETVPAFGLPAEAAPLPFVRAALVAGRFLSESRDSEAVLGTQLARALGFDQPEAAVGKMLTVTVRGLRAGEGGTFRFAESRTEARVVGVWKPPTGRGDFSTRAIILPIGVVRQMPGATFQSALDQLLHPGERPSAGYGRAIVRVRRPADLFPLEEEIQAMGFKTHTLLGDFKEMRTGFLLIDLVLTAVGSVALTVAGLGIINTMLMAVLERYREIGTLKALGASDGDVWILFLVEAALVGVLGGLGGLALGRFVSWVIELSVNAIAISRGLEEELIEFAFPGWLLGGAVLFAVLISLVSGLIPASRAARVDPVRALRAE